MVRHAALERLVAVSLAVELQGTSACLMAVASRGRDAGEKRLLASPATSTCTFGSRFRLLWVSEEFEVPYLQRGHLLNLYR